MATVFVSDLHLADLSGAEDFRYRREFLELCEYVAHRGAALVILGDWLELLQADLSRVLYCHAGLFAELARLARKVPVVWVLGNHDYLPFRRYLGGDFFGIPVRAKVEMRVPFLLAHHGHAYDPWNAVDFGQERARRPVGEYIARLVGVLERVVSPDVDDALGDAANRAASYLRRLLGHPEAARLVADALRRGGDPYQEDLERLLRRGNPGFYGYSRGVLDSFQKRVEENLRRIPHRWLVLGHTHEPLLIRYTNGKGYLNLGSWAYSRFPPTFGLVEGEDVRLLRADTFREYRERYFVRDLA